MSDVLGLGARNVDALLRLSRRRKRLVMLATDAFVIPIVMYVALVLKADALPELALSVARVMAVAAIVAVPIFARLGLYRTMVRYMGARAALVVATGVAVCVAIMIGLAQVGWIELPVTTAIVYGSLLLGYVGTSRMLLRWLLLTHMDGVSRVIIYGAGIGGAELATALNGSGAFVPVAFIDDNPALWGTVIAGIKIYDPTTVAHLLESLHVRRILLAMPALPRRRRREILALLTPLGVHVQTMPTVTDLLSGTARVDELQEVDVTDLLGRNPVPPNKTLLEACIRNKTVMVTGAGGSIGSELCRQILQLGPTRLLLFEMSEHALYSVERELRRLVEQEALAVVLVPLLGNAHHKYRVREILQAYGVNTIYHAAAYKHVPIVEQNIVEGLYNNVFGTWHTAEAALECKVETFVLISTDKAVNPTNVMGATKRFAEILLQGLQERNRGTRFCMVRFGNVLESSGSVVPLFRDQIRRGGPVTVTHPEVIRYFMTIPEAAQLVIQAGSMAHGGDVFVLDMGKPIRIVELAQRMIQLSGLTVRDEKNPDGDIEIQFTGLRPAEKLFEELLIGKMITGTEHPMILRAVEHALPWDQVSGLLNELQIVMRRFDCRGAREVLERGVAEYQPQDSIHDVVWCRRAELGVTAPTDAKITELHPHRPSRAPGSTGVNAPRPD